MFRQVNAPASHRRPRVRLLMARAAWLAVAVPSVTLLVLLIPIHRRTIYYDWQFLSTYSVVAPFLSVTGYAVFLMVPRYLVAAICLITAAFIAWHKADERVAWLAATVLVILPLIFGLTGTSDTWSYYPESWRAILKVLRDTLFLAAGVAGLTAFVFLFPDGRFAPRWTGAIFGLVIAGLALSIVWMALGNDRLYEAWLAVFVAALVIGAGTQLYRYRRLSSPLERQQIKWVVASLTLWVASLPVLIAATAISERTRFGPLVLFVANHVQLLALGFLPLSLAFSIFRYRLWDIDLLIRRTLVYSVLIASLALMYLGSILALQQLANFLIGAGSSEPAVIGSTLLIAAIAAPLNRRVRRAIDRRFYRRKYDAAQALAAFASSARDEVEVERLSERLLAVVDDSVQPAHAHLGIRPASKL
jgi:hypothetical protein